MPIEFGTLVTDVSFDNETGVLICTGEAFGEALDPACNIEYSVHGSGVWVSVDSIDAWADTECTGTVSGIPLAGGSYDVRVTSSDGEKSSVFNNAFYLSTNIFGVVDGDERGFSVFCAT